MDIAKISLSKREQCHYSLPPSPDYLNTSRLKERVFNHACKKDFKIQAAQPSKPFKILYTPLSVVNHPFSLFCDWYHVVLHQQAPVVKNPIKEVVQLRLVYFLHMKHNFAISLTSNSFFRKKSSLLEYNHAPHMKKA